MKIDWSGVNKKNVLRGSIAGLVAILLAVGFAYAWSGYRALVYENQVTREGVEALQVSLKEARDKLANARAENAHLTGQNEDLSTSLRSEQQKTGELQYSIQQQINQISGTVGVLDKLSKTDSELLAKYSKVYFLNENYAPPSVLNIDSKYSSDPKKTQQILVQVLPFLNRMLQDASAQGMELKVVSAYRSFADQAAVKTGYKITYGSGANRFSADQGYSEHQLGTTVDLLNASSTVLTTKFESTSAYKWLNENAYKYGFVLSYPKNNSYYIFEPWHWRFVGVALATDLHNQGKYFYEMSQRDIDNYLVKIFD